MNRDKQIEEMAEEIREVTEASELITDKYGNVYGYRRVGVSDPKQIAEHLIENKGYRKASEVASEIFEEIEAEIELALKSNYNARRERTEHCNFVSLIDGKINALRGIEYFIAELKKKYTEGGE